MPWFIGLLQPGMALAVISGFFYNFYLYFKNNADGLIGLYVAIAGIAYMSGIKWFAKLILPFFVILIIIKSL